MNDSWAQILTVVLANIGVVWWFRKESREDWIRMDTKMEKMKDETNSIINAIHQDMKDFHERLLQIEMNRK